MVSASVLGLVCLTQTTAGHKTSPYGEVSRSSTRSDVFRARGPHAAGDSRRLAYEPALSVTKSRVHCRSSCRPS